MMVRETARTAWRSLVSNRLRTALTALGMVIGVGAVVTVLAIGEGARASVSSQIRSLGSNLLMVRPGSAQSGMLRTGSVQTLIREDARALESVPGIAAVAPEAAGSAQIRYLSENLPASVVGVTPTYLAIRNLELSAGLPFGDIDERQRRRIALIGANVADTLFGDRSPLGERIQIRGIAFVVTGVLMPKGDTFSSPDDRVLVPLATHQGVLFGQSFLSTISVQVADESQTDAVIARIEDLLRLRHRIAPQADSDFEIRSQAEMLQTMGAVTQTLTVLLGSVAAVSLLVGGIGIMNIMLVSVRERTREIGVRMAVGAKRRDVLLQFLVEAVVVSVGGGLVGIALGYGGAMGVASIGGWTTIVPPYALGLSLVVSVGVGVIFGVGPARRASRLDPVEALRDE